MPITINDGGVLHELETVTTNIGGVLHELDTVHANEGGVLHEIHSAASFPSSLTWEYTGGTTGYTPTVSNNGFTVKNTRSDVAYNNVKSSIFEIKGKVKITLTMTMENRYTNGSGGVGIYPESGGNAGYISLYSTGSKTETYELTAGRYHISGGGGSGNQSGSAANNYTISVSFSK